MFLWDGNIMSGVEKLKIIYCFGIEEHLSFTSLEKKDSSWEFQENIEKEEKNMKLQKCRYTI